MVTMSRHRFCRIQAPRNQTRRKTVPDDKHRVETRLTLGLSELALVNTSLNGLVELGIESGLEGNVDLVVRGNILLDGPTAILRKKSQYHVVGRKPDATMGGVSRSRRQVQVEMCKTYLLPLRSFSYRRICQSAIEKDK